MTSPAGDRFPRRSRIKRLPPLDTPTHEQLIHGLRHEPGPLDFVDEDEALGGDFFRIRKPEKRFPRDPARWIGDNHMTKTEVSLRLAHYLLTRKLVSSEIAVALTGYELTRREKPKFPVVTYLKGGGYTRGTKEDEWRGTYTIEGADHPLRLHTEWKALDFITTLTSGKRFVGFTQRGLISDTRSPAEHKLLRGAVGKAVTSCDTLPDDIVAAVLPRSGRFRQLAATYRSAHAMLRAGTMILLVDRAGEVDGFPD